MMKKLSILVIAAVSAALSVAYAEQADHWTYNGSTITDDEWTFAATVKAGTTEMTVGDYSQYPTSGILNFAKPVKDGVGTIYTIVTLNPHLCTGTDYRNSSASDASKAVTELYLPATGLTEISGGAFAHMTNCTKVEPFIPDSVVTIGEGVFKGVQCGQDLRLIGVSGTIGVGAFTASKITSATFGPGLKKIRDWSVGPFSTCSELTNVTFSAAMTNALFEGIRDSGFNNCSKLKGTVDLTGFSDLSHVTDSGGKSNPFSGTALDTVIIGADCTKLGAKFFCGMGSLTTVRFMGPPPEIITTAKGACRTAGKLFDDKSADKTMVVYVKEEYKEQWAPYSATGEINDTDTKFSSDWATDVAEVYLLIEGGGGGGGELGNWVFDGSVVSNGVWSFEASCIIRNLTVGACTKYPDEPSLLDFTDTFTDANGVPLTIKALNTAFSSNKGVATTAAAKVGELRIPLSVATIGAGAFGNLSKCTNVVNFLPDTVTTIGAYAFYKLPVQQDLSLKGIACLGTGPIGSQATQTFGSSGITGVTFGPGLKDISSWDNGAFKNCSSITNITFDAAMSGGKFSGIRYDGFHGCSALVGTVDLSGFENLSYIADYGSSANVFAGTKVEHFIVGTNCLRMAAGFFDGVSTLRDVTFMGPPPEITTNANTSTGWGARQPSRFYDYKQSSLTITTYITKQYRSEWAPYVLYHGEEVDRVPPGKGVTWKPEYVTEGIDLSLRPVRIIDLEPGLKLIVR